MPRKLIRIYDQGTLHFITFSCYQRRALLGSARARNLFVRLLDETRERYGFALYGYVVMPDHVHLLIGEPKRGTPSTVMQVLKQRVSREMRRNRRRRQPPGQLALPFLRSADALPHFWQARFYDFNVWSARKIREKLDYMHQNPVKRRLVTRAEDWAWSSHRHYVQMGEPLVRMDPM